MIQFNNYQKNYGPNLILEIQDLHLPQGIYWLKGENGSGKTTLLKSMGGLLPFDGDIAVSGVGIKKDRVAFRRIVNYTEAEPLYPGYLTGEDLVRFFEKTRAAAPGPTKLLMEAFGVDKFAANKVSTYSSGMTKKLSLVLGFIGSPKLVLLDEPLITLDKQALETLKGVILDYHSRGTAFMITSHQDIEFEQLFPVQLLVKDKKLLQL